jgi:hypothetical protein
MLKPPHVSLYIHMYKPFGGLKLIKGRFSGAVAKIKN